MHQPAQHNTGSRVWDEYTWWCHHRGRQRWDRVPQEQPSWLRLLGKSYKLQSFKVYNFDFALLGPQNYETDLVNFWGCSIAGLFRFLLSFVLMPSSDLRERPIRILEGLGGQAGCHMYWALGS